MFNLNTQKQMPKEQRRHRTWSEVRFPSRPRVLRLQLPPSTAGQSLGGRSSPRRRRGRGSRDPSSFGQGRGSSPPRGQSPGLWAWKGWKGLGQVPRAGPVHQSRGPRALPLGKKSESPSPKLAGKTSSMKKRDSGLFCSRLCPQGLLLDTKAEFTGRRVCLPRTSLRRFHSYLNCAIYTNKNGGPRTSQVGQRVKNLPAMQEPQETWVQSLGQEDPLEEGNRALQPFGSKKESDETERLSTNMRQDTHRSGNNRGSLPP